MSSNSCLNHIRQNVLSEGFDVSAQRIRQACLSNNFNIQDATNKLLLEEKFKIYLGNLSIKMGHVPNKKLIKCSCDRFKFKSLQVEKYVLKLLKAKENVHNRCIEANITISDTDLYDKIIASFGNEQFAFMSIQQDL
jgi:hypothetical protein